jgi:hypothetical protein
VRPLRIASDWALAYAIIPRARGKRVRTCAHTMVTRHRRSNGAFIVRRIAKDLAHDFVLMLDFYKREDMRLWQRCFIVAFLILTMATLCSRPESRSLLRFWDSGRTQPWHQVARAKREGELAKIPEDWRLSKDTIEEARRQKVIAGAFIEGLLDQNTLRITRLDPVDLVESTSNGSLSAYDLVKAFCKRAAYGHQLVRRSLT